MADPEYLVSLCFGSLAPTDTVGLVTSIPTPPPTPAPSPKGVSSDALSGADFLDFVASIVSSTAWPLVVLTLFLIFRSQVRKLVDEFAKRIAKLQRVKGSWGEVEWSDKTLEEVADEIDERNTSSPGSAPKASDEEEEIAIKLARVQPSAGVIAAFIELERELGLYLTALGIEWSGSPVVAMKRAPGVSENIKKLVSRLAYLRNAAAHGKSDVSYDSAVEYIRATIELARQVQALTVQQAT